MVLPQTDEKHAGQGEGMSLHADLQAAIEANQVPAELTSRWPGYAWRAEVAFVIDLSTRTARELGAGINRKYPEAGPFDVFGTADLVGRKGDQLVIVDRKSFDPNVSRSSRNGQLHTLALMACRAYGVEMADVAIWHELRPMDVSNVDLFDLLGYEKDLHAILEQATRARAEFRKTGLVSATPGKHCRWCSAFHSCPAQSSMLTQIRTGVIGARVAAISLDKDDDAAAAYQLSKDIGMIKKRLDAMLYARAELRPIPIGDGVVFGKRAKQGNRVLDGDKAYELIRQKHGQKVADAAVTREATQKGIEDAFKSAGIAGAKGEKDRLVFALERDGGVTRKDGWVVDEHDDERPMLKAVP